MEIFLNGSDIEAKKKFVSENILPDVQPIFQMAESTETPENNKLKNPTVIETADYTDKDGGKDKLVLIQGEKSSSNSELIIFIKDDKVGWGYSSNDKDKDAFNEVRKLFKEPVISTSDSGNAGTTEQSPEATLKEISNFVVSDIWNDGFVDISWYAGSGTGSTGETIDIDFTIEQLGKAMIQKWNTIVISATLMQNMIQLKASGLSSRVRWIVCTNKSKIRLLLQMMQPPK